MYIRHVRLNPALPHTGKNSPAPCLKRPPSETLRRNDRDAPCRHICAPQLCPLGPAPSQRPSHVCLQRDCCPTGHAVWMRPSPMHLHSQPACACIASPRARIHGKRLRTQLQSVGLRVPTCARVRWMARCSCPHVRGPGVRAYMFVPGIRAPECVPRYTCPVCVPTCACRGTIFFQTTICF